MPSIASKRSAEHLTLQILRLVDAGLGDARNCKSGVVVHLWIDCLCPSQCCGELSKIANHGERLAQASPSASRLLPPFRTAARVEHDPFQQIQSRIYRSEN